MNCKYCNSENPEEAKFCLSCGKKLSGQNCPSCGTDNPDTAVYCLNCGTRLDGKAICPSCKAEVPEGHVYCITCGTKVRGKSKNDADIKPSAASKIMRTISLSLAISLAVISVIFTVFMGCKLTGIGDALAEIGVNNNFNLFYFFGDAYNEWSLMKELSSYFEPIYLDVVRMQTVLGTIICAATLITTLILSIMAIVKCARSFKGSETKGGALAVGSFMAFVAGSSCLYSLTSATSMEWSITVKFNFNGATIAGFTLGGIVLCAYLVLAILSDPKARIKRSYWANGIFVLVSSVLLIVILAVIVSPSMQLIAVQEFGLKVNLSQFGLAMMSAMNLEEATSVVIMSILGFAFICYAIICSAWAVASHVKNLRAEKPNCSLALSIQIFIASVCALVLTVIAYNKFVELLEIDPTELAVKFTSIIVTVVFATIYLASQITHKALKHKLDN